MRKRLVAEIKIDREFEEEAKKRGLTPDEYAERIMAEAIKREEQREEGPKEKIKGHEIVQKHRDKWLDKFIEAVRSDDVEAIKAIAKVVAALTECYWDLFDRGV